MFHVDMETSYFKLIEVILRNSKEEKMVHFINNYEDKKNVKVKEQIHF